MSDHSSETAYIVACVCSQSVGLSNSIGLPVVLVEVTQNVPRLLEQLRRTRYGALVRGDGGTGHCTLESGWNDWDVLPIEAKRQGAAAAGVCFSTGRIVVPLPPGLTLAEYRAELIGALRHLTLRRVLDRLEFPLSGDDASASRPRYARVGAPERSVRLRPVENLYVLDPTDAGDAMRLFWLAASARLAASVGGAAAWR